MMKVWINHEDIHYPHCIKDNTRNVDTARKVYRYASLDAVSCDTASTRMCSYRDNRMKPAISLTLEEWETLLDQRGELVFKHGDGSTYTIKKRIYASGLINYIFTRDYGPGTLVKHENFAPTLLSAFLSIIFVYHNDTVDMTVDADTEHIGMLPAAKESLHG